jgi:hypothetical protein
MGNLPTPRDKDSASLERIKAVKGLLDGLMSVGNGSVPSRAEDIGDVDERANPRACDLEYVEGVRCFVDDERGKKYLHDAPNAVIPSRRWVAVDENSFIEDLRAWA